MASGLATSAKPMIGQRIGAYIITRELARGAMGVVYEAMHDTIGHRAAIKVLSSELSKDPAHADFVGRFVDEARAVNVIQHPGIVKIFDIGMMSDGTVYIMMEFLEGQSLYARGRKFTGRRFPLRDALRITRQIASALVPAHDKRIIHRDLKPENIVLIRDPEAPDEERTKVLDFGVARFLDSPQRRTAVGMVMGTATYMAPEQCEGSEQMDGKMDVYALGIILYEMLVGQPPFEGDPSPVMIAHLRTAPHPLRERAKVPEAVHQLCHEMLAKTPAGRPTMEQVSQRMRIIESGLPPPVVSGALSVEGGAAGRPTEVQSSVAGAGARPGMSLMRPVALPLWALVLGATSLCVTLLLLAWRLLSAA